MDFEHTLSEVSWVAAESIPAHVERDAHQILALINEWIPLAGCSVAAYDPVERRHLTVASDGYPPSVVEYLDTGFVTRDEAFSFMENVDPTPRRWRDFPFDYGRSFSIQEVFGPNGYTDGTTMRLYTRDGRYTGCLHLNADSEVALAGPTVTHLLRLQGVLGALVDKNRAIAGLLATMPTAADGTALVRLDGSIAEVAGTEQGPMLTADSDLVSALLRFSQSGVSKISRWRDHRGRWHTVHTQAVPGGLLVRESTEPLPYMLTSAELQVLDGLTRGSTNSAIASSIGCSARTIGKHLEHIFIKIGCGTRSHAAVIAASQGLTVLQ
ncbi:helix-turn-helix transcriptional regulator [Rhodococcus sp. IEGM 1354]|uniref:helix-turn-helix transcriptional regulator n=1 Tax=Rhodococcus sp. IEGM 1354 TaxID=3047088 RepID=UPI0024B760A7|nr:helix-turn-helix transcriptional regulator [Rhodococcus sp. IEGM 1354]MDI9933048.1 helix-turn-helix transcriptional regulator [Rhodococcus sp. IEGM 1354]